MGNTPSTTAGDTTTVKPTTTATTATKDTASSSASSASTSSSSAPTPPQRPEGIIARALREREARRKAAGLPLDDNASSSNNRRNPFDSLHPPEQSDSHRHTYGQPLRPNLDSAGNQKSKFITDCTKQHRESLTCIQDNYEYRNSVCQPYFEAYKTCRREENEKRKRENAAGRGVF